MMCLFHAYVAAKRVWDGRKTPDPYISCTEGEGNHLAQAEAKVAPRVVQFRSHETNVEGVVKFHGASTNAWSQRSMSGFALVPDEHESSCGLVPNVDDSITFKNDSVTFIDKSVTPCIM